MMQFFARISATFLAFLAVLYTAEAALTISTPSGGTGTESTVENNAANAAIITVAATSPGQTVGDFTLLSTDVPFSVAVSGEVTVPTAKALDYEVLSKYELKIKVVDDASGEATATVTVSITDANDPPSFMPTVCAKDGTAVGTTVTTVSAHDQDGDTLTYSITGGNTNTDFEISGDKIKVKNKLVMSTTNNYPLVVEAADAAATATTTVSVTVSASCTGSGTTAVVVSLLTLLTALAVALN